MISIRRQQALLACTIGMAGALVIATPKLLEFEEEAGLDWLFLLRGPIEPPPDVVVVSIDSESAAALELRLDPQDWPRSLYAEAIERLSTAGAAVTAVDLSFQQARDPGEDQMLANSIREAGNVILLEWMVEPSTGPGSRPSGLEIQRRFPPIPLLADAALGSAPFALPVDPSKVSRYWVFGRIDTDRLMLPSAAVHAFALDGHDDFLDLIEAVRSGSTATLPRRAEFSSERNLTSAGRQIRRLFQGDPELSADLRDYIATLRANRSPDQSWDRHAMLVDQLIALYGGPEYRHLDFYGPPRTIRTIPYVHMRAMRPEDARAAFEGRIVFFGVSEPGNSLQEDDVQTPFTEDGINLNGVEIGATAVANLLEGRFVHPVPKSLLLPILLLWGSVLVGVLLWLPTRLGILAAVIAGAAYVFLALRLFETNGIWLPIVAPVFGQIPLALISVFAWKLAHERRQRDRVQRTLEVYLPKRALEKLSHRVEGALPDAQLLHGTCLVTDAQNYTALAERLPPQELQKALNAYYAVLFPEVERLEGFVADVIGDSMVAVWATPGPDAIARLNACRAAIAIERSTRAFNAANPHFPLPTRIGIHAGEILLGNVGTESHREYRPIGDIVNTASRIQDFNKRLHTTMLVSEDVLQDAGLASYRRLGAFLLAGKGVPIRLCDRISFASQPEPEHSTLIAAFDEAHRLFLGRRWAEAAAAFDKLLAGHPADGPSTFYRTLCYRFAANDPGPQWTGAVNVAMT